MHDSSAEVTGGPRRVHVPPVCLEERLEEPWLLSA